MTPSPSTLTLSLIVLNWNGHSYIDKCLDALVAQDYPRVEIILVDNASTDDSLQIVKSRYPNIRLVENGENLGFAAGMNVGLRVATGDILVLLNNDVILKPDWAAAMAAAMSEDPRLGVAGGKLLYPDEKTIQHAGAYLRYPQAFTGHYGYREIDQGQCQSRREVDFVTGAALALRRTVIEEVGELDEGYFFYFEEADLIFRARQAGWRVAYLSEAVGMHLESASLNRESLFYFCNIHRSRLRFVFRQYGRARFLRDTFAAEQNWLKFVVLPTELRALRQVYLETLMSFGDIPYVAGEQDPPDQRQWRQTAAAFRQLRQAVLARQAETEAWLVERA